MQAHTTGIVLKTSRYGNSSIISRVYTRSFGLLSFVIKGVFRPKSSMPISLFRPLHFLNMELHYRQNRNFQYIKEASIKPVLKYEAISPEKAPAGIFIAELLEHCLSVGGEADENLYDFLELTLQEFNNKVLHPNFPLYFFIRFSAYMGIQPVNDYSEEQPYFNIAESGFTSYQTGGYTPLSAKESACVAKLIDADSDTYHTLSIPNNIKRTIIQTMDAYYAYHLPGYKKLNSYSILTDVIK